MTEQKFARRERNWFFDFDGTLSKIVPDREQATLEPECREMLETLCNDASQNVVVLSSRSLDDLARRMSSHCLILAGSNGMEWQLPNGEIYRPDQLLYDEMQRNRLEVLPVLADLRRLRGVSLEDKRWSITVHYRQVDPADRRLLGILLDQAKSIRASQTYDGPEALEVIFTAVADKESGVERICRSQGWLLSGGQIVYCGDDENDAGAMRWVLRNNGVAIVVGDRIQVPGALGVEDPATLADLISRMFHEDRLSLQGGRPGA